MGKLKPIKKTKQEPTRPRSCYTNNLQGARLAFMDWYGAHKEEKGHKDCYYYLVRLLAYFNSKKVQDLKPHQWKLLIEKLGYEVFNG